MASSNPPVPAASTTGASCGGCCSAQTLSYLFLRLMIAMILILAGLEKFKSSTPPYTYSMRNYHGVIENGEIVESGRWLPIVKVVFENSGLNNEAYFKPEVSDTISWAFYFYGQVLPYAMLALGVCILLGFLNRICLVLGACLWLSLAAGQMMLPDNPTALMLLNYAFFTIAALALVRYNRFAITRF
jgi:uncharacterized membrane protein YphA (DoxX/SURF4 family)